MNRILRSPRARLDIIEIWGFIADDNEAAADAVLDKIEHALSILRDNPLAGRARPELARDIRSFVVGNMCCSIDHWPMESIWLASSARGRTFRPRI